MTVWDERFSTPDYRYGLDPNRFLVEVASRLPAASRIIAAGDGEGRNGVWLAQQGHRVLAIDASAAGLEKAQRLATTRGVTLETLQADLAAFSPEPASADAVVLIYVHMPPAIRRAAHHSLMRALKPGGLLILEAFHPLQLGRGSGGPNDPTLFYDLGTLKEDFGHDIEVALGWEGEVELDEGAGHKGTGHVVRLLGVKR